MKKYMITALIVIQIIGCLILLYQIQKRKTETIAFPTAEFDWRPQTKRIIEANKKHIYWHEGFGVGNWYHDNPGKNYDDFIASTKMFYFDPESYIFRPYISKDEVFHYLSKKTDRTEGLEVIINSTGTFHKTGDIIGGKRESFYFKNDSLIQK